MKYSLILWLKRIGAILWVLFCLKTALSAQPITLKPVHDLATSGTHTFPEVLGRVERVQVVNETGKQLHLRVFYAGYTQAFVSLEVLGHQKKVLKKIPPIKGSLAGKSQAFEIMISSNSKAPADCSLRSKYVRLAFSRPPGFVGPNSPAYLYKYHKAWCPGEGGVRTVVSGGSSVEIGSNSSSQTGSTNTQNQSELRKVTLRAIGSAQQLGKGSLPVPNQVVLSESPIATTDSVIVDSIKVKLDKSPYGPGFQTVSLWDGLRSDVDFSLDEITNVNLNLIRDANPNNASFYYLPNSYTLEWNQQRGIEGFALKNLYSTAAETGQEGAVRIHAQLSPKISQRELAMVKQLTQSYARTQLGFSNIDMKPLPVAGTPNIQLAEGLQNLYDVAANRVSVQAYSDLTQPLQIAWATDSRTKDEIVVALTEGVGVSGSLRVQPKGDSLATQSIPVNLAIDNPSVFGKFELNLRKWRRAHWQHTVPFPVKLHYLHILMLQDDGENPSAGPYIYSYALDGAIISPNQKVVFDARQMPLWVDKSPYTQLMWLEYSVEDCSDCAQTIMEATLGGTSRSSRQQITFETINLFGQTGASVLQIRARSRQADPKGKLVLDLSLIQLRQDGVETTGPLHIPPGQSPAFEYQVSMIMEDGTQYRSERWISAQDLSVFVGMKTIQELFPQFVQP